MEQFIIKGNQKLTGTVKISGAKNAALPIFFAAILGTEKIVLNSVPNLSDIAVTCAIFEHMGAKVEKDFANKRVTVYPQGIVNYEVPYELASKMRASFWALAPMVARFGRGQVALPGGCSIGSRPVDMHIDAMKKLGAQVEIAEGNMIVTAPNGLVGNNIFFDKVSVGATISAVCAAVLAKGTSRIENVAMEPEVVDVCNFLVMMGAKIDGIGTRNLTIEGVTKLTGGEYTIIPDRIECGTYLVAAVISRSKITCENVKPDHLESVIEKLREAGAEITINQDKITCDMHGKRAKSVNITTQTYPGVPTDMQAQFTLLNVLAEGSSFITETIFENRFMHVPELIRMGAQITQKSNTIYITGIDQLSGAEVKATDLRASISLVLAGCIASGTTIVDEIYHIDRGYELVEKQIANLGCEIVRRPQTN